MTDLRLGHIELQLDDDYVRKHARPGEDWEPARHRLASEVGSRHTQVPDCPVCTQNASSIELAEFDHSRGACWPDAWSPEALSQKKLDTLLAHRKTHIAAMANVARGHITSRMVGIKSQNHPINALIEARSLQGFLSACEVLGVFENNELIDMRLAAYGEEEKSHSAFMELHRKDAAAAVPWRDMTQYKKTTA